MALAYVAVGASTNNATTITPALPAGVPTDGTGLFVAAIEHRFTTTCPTPTGWTLAGTVQATVGSEAADSGTATMSVFTRVAQAGDTAPSYAPTTPSVVAGAVHGYSCAAGKTFSLATVTGADVTANTAHSAVGGSDPGGAVGDVLFIGTGVNGSAVTSTRTSTSLVWTGITGTITQRAISSAATGNGFRWWHDDVFVTAGPSSSAPNRTWTYSTSTATHPAAAVVYVRIREVAAVTQVTGTVATSWTVRAQVTATKATSWTVRAAITSTIDSAWNISAVIAGLLFEEHFEGATAGTAISTANTAFTAVTGAATAQFAASPILAGGQVGVVTTTSSNAAWFGSAFGSTSGSLFVRAYVRLPSSVSAQLSFLRVMATTTVRAGVAMLASTGQIRLSDGASTVDTSVSGYASTPVRCEWELVGTTQTLRIYSGANLHTATPTETLTGARTVAAADVVGYGFNVTIGVASTVVLDALAVSDTSMPARVLTQVTATRASSWNIAGSATQVTSTRASAWGVLAQLTATAGSSWTVRAQVTSTRAGSWNVASAVTATAGTAWRVLARVTVTVVSAWSVRAQVTPTAGSAWNVAGATTPVTSTRPAAWTVLARVTGTASAAWNVAATTTAVTRTLSSAWTVRAYVTGTRAASWNVAGSVAQVASSSWTVRATATRTAASSWNVRAAVTATRAGAWNVAGPSGQVTGTAQTAWTVRTVVTSTAVSSWRVLTAVTATTGAAWSVRSQVTQGVTSQWAVRVTLGEGTFGVGTFGAGVFGVGTTTVTTTATVAWSVRSQVSSVRGSAWTVRAQLSAVRGAAWSIIGTVTSTRTSGWTVRATVTSTRTTSWTVLVSAGVATRGAAWSVRAQVTGTRPAGWTVRGQPTAMVTVAWTIRATVTSSRATAWSVAVTLASPATRTTAWTVRAQVTGSIGSAWSVTAVVPAHVTIYSIIGPTSPAAASGPRAGTASARMRQPVFAVSGPREEP